jgi:hypothetical protein
VGHLGLRVIVEGGKEEEEEQRGSYRVQRD